MRESRTYGFVRGVPGDQHPYRDSQPFLFELSLHRGTHGLLNRAAVRRRWRLGVD